MDKKRILIFSLLIISVMCINSVSAHNMSGTVEDSSGTALAGVTVTANNTTHFDPAYTTTGIDGTFLLESADPYTVDILLTFSKSGYNTQTDTTIELSEDTDIGTITMTYLSKVGLLIVFIDGIVGMADSIINLIVMAITIGIVVFIGVKIKGFMKLKMK